MLVDCIEGEKDLAYMVSTQQQMLFGPAQTLKHDE